MIYGKRVDLIYITIFISLIVIFCSRSAAYSQNLQSDVIIPEFKQSTQALEKIENIPEIAFADIDSDGDLDAVCSSMFSPSFVLVNDGKGSFSPSGQIFSNDMHGIAIGDLDGDKDQDLFFAYIRKNGPSPIFLNNGHGVFKRSAAPLSLDATETIHLIDVENDGDLDAFVTPPGLICLNDGKGNFTKSSSTLPPMCRYLHDLNGDGFADFIRINRREGFAIFLNDKKGNFAEYSFLQKEEIDNSYIAFFDLDNDGDADVIYNTYYSDRNYTGGILINDGSGTFTDSGQKLSRAKYGRLGTGDLNNDGFADAILTDWENPAQVWMNNRKGELIDSGIRLGESDGKGWIGCNIKDFDNDGDMDVFITNRLTGKHGLWFNQLIK